MEKLYPSNSKSNSMFPVGSSNKLFCTLWYTNKANCRKSPLLMGKLYMNMFRSYVSHYQRASVAVSSISPIISPSFHLKIPPQTPTSHLEDVNVFVAILSHERLQGFHLVVPRSGGCFFLANIFGWWLSPIGCI